MSGGKGRGIGRLAGALSLLGLSGCSLFFSPRREFVHQEDVLEATARAAGFSPDGRIYQLIFSEVSRDSLIFQYRGVENPDDQAWAIRFSQKSSEQKPDDLGRLNDLLQAIQKGKEAFEVGKRDRRELKGLAVEFAPYRFHSVLKGRSGDPLIASGMAAVVRVDGVPAPLIFQLNVQNITGRRPEVGWEQMEPLVQAIQR
jgi:hypothetical protein